jgi:hypothetical protein
MPSPLTPGSGTSRTSATRNWSSVPLALIVTVCSVIFPPLSFTLTRTGCRPIAFGVSTKLPPVPRTRSEPLPVESTSQLMVPVTFPSSASVAVACSVELPPGNDTLLRWPTPRESTGALLNAFA